MTFIRIVGFKIFADRHGKMRCYHRKIGEKIDLDKFPLGSAEFLAECSRIQAVSEALKAIEPKAGTLGALMQFYEETDHFRDDLSTVSQKDYRWCRSFLENVKDTPIHIIDTPLIAGFHDIASEKRGFRRGTRASEVPLKRRKLSARHLSLSRGLPPVLSDQHKNAYDEMTCNVRL